MPEPRIRWRDRLALWCLRILTPNGILPENVAVGLHFHSGDSTPEDPKLVMAVKYPSGRQGQTIVAVVLGSPDEAAADINEYVAGLRDWAEAYRG